MTTKAAFDLWQAGRLEEAAACYREALDAMPADDDVRGEIHGELAAVLQGLGDHAGALFHLEAALEGARRVAGSEAPLAVVVTRYFLADHLRQQGRSEDALAAIAPSLDAGSEKAWMLYVVEAEALLALGRREYAAVAAERALALAPSDEKRAELAVRLAAAGLG
ncbi:MAG: tetratricopeptide repeat protein [Vicinamibacteria bacterium]|jgi:tetratricopeptide (TPR) repeat protein